MVRRGPKVTRAGHHTSRQSTINCEGGRHVSLGWHQLRVDHPASRQLEAMVTASMSRWSNNDVSRKLSSVMIVPMRHCDLDSDGSQQASRQEVEVLRRWKSRGRHWTYSIFLRIALQTSVCQTNTIVFLRSCNRADQHQGREGAVVPLSGGLPPLKNPIFYVPLAT